MGFNKTSITHYDENEISFFDVIPIGGNHITKDLSKILDIDLLDAEKLKLNFDKGEDILLKKKLPLDLIQKIIFARIEEILELCIKSIKLNHNLNQSYQFKLILMGDGSKILDNKFKEMIVFSKEIDLLEETNQDICEAAFKLSEGINKQEVVIKPKKQIKVGFFEKLFDFFN
jgi:cell division protein FtsA